MQEPEKKAKGFTLIELLVVIAIIGFISSLSYPSFSSWIESRNTSDAVTKAVTAFRSATTQIQRGVYPFVQVHVENSNDKVIIVTRGMGQENFNQNRPTLNCSLDETYWDNKNINYFVSKDATVNLNPGAGGVAAVGAICFSKDATYYSGAGDFAIGGVDSAIFICSRKEVLKLSNDATVACEALVDDKDPLNPVVKPRYTDSKNFYTISWSIFGNIVTEKWDRNANNKDGSWIERQ
jgi:prepilin-type N-terminal cleavage/methylation domain-containing protein